jgi:hypothetical protein
MKWKINVAILAVSVFLYAGCAEKPQDASAFMSATNAPLTPEKLAEARAMIESRMDAKERKEFEDRLHGLPPPPSDFPFPNDEGYAHHPRPIQVNFYCVDDHYPFYLECEYDVDEKHYSTNNEAAWFKASLKQIRHYGPEKFPPLKWIAVIISNYGEYKDVSTFESCHKVGAIFKAEEVFDSSFDLSQLVAQVERDRHPFKYDTSQPTPGEQQRWVIVERAATNNATIDLK